MSNLLFRNEPERTGKGLQFQIRKASQKELDAEDAELAELIESDSKSLSAKDLRPEQTKIDLASAVAFMKQYEQKQAAAKAEADRKQAVEALADAMRKARGL